MAFILAISILSIYQLEARSKHSDSDHQHSDHHHSKHDSSDHEKEHEKSCCSHPIVYGQAYSTTNQLGITPLSPILMEQIGIMSQLIDFSKTGTNGEITMQHNGIYNVDFTFHGQLSAPFPFPVPAWSISLFKNGALVPGSTLGNFTISPDDILTHTGGSTLVFISAGDVLQFKNTSTLNLDKLCDVLGTTVPISGATVSITLVQSL